MISYLIYSTICLGLVLLFYHVFLAREKMYQINRFYLLFGLLFSLIIPFAPVGITNSLLNSVNSSDLPIPQLISSGIDNTDTESIKSVPANPTEKNYEKTTSGFEWIYPPLLFLYSIITLFLFIRMIGHLCGMRLQSRKRPCSFIRGHKIILLNDDVDPHAFWKTIFVNKKKYENGKIAKEVLIHELTHARQNHSLDIVIVEILKTLFWFNPILYFYKRAIQLNHEFIADNKVLKGGADIADYQTLLLRMLPVKTVPHLSTGLNLKITKKRFKMMTQNNSTYRSLLKTAVAIPFFLILGLTFGCEPDSLEVDNPINNITLEFVNSKTIKLNGESLLISELESQLSDLSIDKESFIVLLKVPETISMSTIMNVQELLRNHGLLRVNYSIVQAKDSWVERL